MRSGAQGATVIAPPVRVLLVNVGLHGGLQWMCLGDNPKRHIPTLAPEPERLPRRGPHQRKAAAGVVGQPGRTHALGDGLWEMRIDYGPGYRLYYIREGAEVIVLLCGGDKDPQSRDIERARQLAGERS